MEQNQELFKVRLTTAHRNTGKWGKGTTSSGAKRNQKLLPIIGNQENQMLLLFLLRKRHHNSLSCSRQKLRYPVCLLPPPHSYNHQVHRFCLLNLFPICSFFCTLNITKLRQVSASSCPGQCSSLTVSHQSIHLPLASMIFLKTQIQPCHSSRAFSIP